MPNLREDAHRGKKLRVALVGFSFNHPTAKRSFAVFDMLAKHKDVELDIITVKNWGGYRYPDYSHHTKENVRIHFLNSLFFSNPPSQYKSGMPWLYFKLLRLRPDIVLALEEPATINALSSLLAAKTLRVPFVVVSWENLYKKWFFPLNVLEKLVARNASAFIAGTNDVKKVFMKKGVLKEKIVEFPLSGIDTEAFKPIPGKQKLRAHRQRKDTIIYVGRLIEMKGILTIFRAREILRKAGKKYHYVFVGFGAHNDKKVVGWIEKEVKNYNDITLYYDMVRQDLPRIFNSAAISLYPSTPQPFWAEQFGYSVAESLSCEVPVIASDVTGPRYIITDGADGFLIQPKDAGELANKIQFLMENKRERTRFGRHGREQVLKKFSNEVIARKYYNTLTKFGS